jgi:hypothetical protein
MLTPEQLSELPDNVVKLYEELEDDILRDMARRIVKTDFATETAQWQLSRLQEMGITHDAVFDKLSKATGKSDAELIAMFNEAAETAYNADKKAYVKAGYNPTPLAENQQLQKIINAGLVKTQALFQNLTNTTANTATQQFENALDTAYMQIVSGAFDYNTAIRTCIKTLAEKGIATIKYPTGHTDYLDVAVRRAALTGVGQTTGEMQLALAEEMGSDLIEVTAHNGARPSHMEWQGKVYSLSGTHAKYPDFVKSTGYGTGDGLKGWNCRHDFFPFFEDSEPAYTQEELNEYENRKVTYNGVEMSEYDATQKQRAFERRIRATKRELTAFDAGIKETDNNSLKESLQAEFDRKSVLLKKQEAKIKDFTQQTGLYRDRAREQSYGFNKSVSLKAVHKAEKHYQTWIHDIGATGKAPKTLAEYYKNKYNDTWEHQLLIGYNNAVKKGDISPLVGFEQYTKIAEEANIKLIGKKTSNEYTINAYTTHFIDRVIGQVSTSHDGKRLGVSIDDVLECLTNSDTNISKPYNRSLKRNNETIQDERIRFIGKDCVVTISTTDGKIIQVNPRS